MQNRPNVRFQLYDYTHDDNLGVSYPSVVANGERYEGYLVDTYGRVEGRSAAPNAQQDRTATHRIYVVKNERYINSTYSNTLDTYFREGMLLKVCDVRHPKTKLWIPIDGTTAMYNDRLSHWKFEDVLTSSVGTYTWVFNDAPTYVAGTVGTKAVRTTNTEAHITNDDFNFLDSACHLSFWFRRQTGTDSVRIGFENGTYAWRFVIEPTTVYIETDGATLVEDAYTVPNNTWTFVSMNYDGTTMSLRVNNRTVVADTFAGFSDQTGGSLRMTIGTDIVDIDDMISYARALSNAEIDARYAKLAMNRTVDKKNDTKLYQIGYINNLDGYDYNLCGFLKEFAEDY